MRPDSCPICDSPMPQLHPVRGETYVYYTLDVDYVEECQDPWHKELA